MARKTTGKTRRNVALHAQRRALERFDAYYSKDDLFDMAQRIRDHDPSFQFVKRQSNTRTWYRTLVNDRDAIVVYDKRVKSILTFLYPKGVEDETVPSQFDVRV